MPAWHVDSFEKRIPAESLRIVRQMLGRKFNSPMTSSAGRLFDAVASLIGVRDRVRYEETGRNGVGMARDECAAGRRLSV